MSIGGRSRLSTPIRRTRPRVESSAALLSETCETFPNDGLLASTTEDLTWTVGTGDSLTVASGLLRSTSAPSSDEARAEHDTATSDMFVEVDWVGGDVTDQIFLTCRGGNTSEHQTDDAIFLYVFWDGVDTQIQIDNWSGPGTALDATLTSQSPVGATWRLVVQGTTATAYRNGVQVLTGSIADFSPYPTGTRAGIEIDDSGAGLLTVDNFCVGPA